MTQSLHMLIQYLRHRIPHCGDAALTDAHLLERWVGQHDPAAFELMLWRHSPMVLNTCRRLLPRREDVEDAFQATFLVLVRKAGSIRRREALAAWLHRVACRIAERVRAANVRRSSREQSVADVPAAAHVDTPSECELFAIVDEEIESLPAHYRRVLILCCLEGKSQEEAARLLNRPRGTVSSWLTRGQERLRQRLLRRGIVVSMAALTAALTPDALSSGGMIPLIGSLVRMAGAVAAGSVLPAGLMSARSIALAEGVLRMMFMTKVKLVAAVALVVAVAAAGVGTWSHATWAGDDSLILNEKTPKEERLREPLPKAGRLTEPLPEAKINVGDYIAWGEKAHGLQAGIAFRRGDQETYELGQSVTFVVYLRNASDKEINLSHIEPLFDESMPVVVDADGRHLAVAPGPIKLGRVPITHRSVEAGQHIILGYPWFRIRPLDWRGEVIGPTCCAEPGRYKVGYTSLLLRLGDGKDISLGTKQVELTIRKREAAKEDRAEGKAPRMEKLVLPAIENQEQARLFFLSSHSLSLPFKIDQEKIREVRLLVSRDQGRTWKQVDKKTSSERSLVFHAPEDGTYSFILQQVDKNGRLVPADPRGVKPDIRVCVDTKPPVLTLQALLAPHDEKAILLRWTAEDANLEDKPVRLIEWSDQKDSPGIPIISGPLPSKGDFTWNLPETPPGITARSDCYVRVHVRDKAGNDACAVIYFNLKKDE